MFRRSKIKITPKIPQAKSGVDRSNESSSTPTTLVQQQSTSEQIDSTDVCPRLESGNCPKDGVINPPDNTSGVARNVDDQGEINQVKSPGSHTSPKSTSTTPVNETDDSISTNQLTDNQQQNRDAPIINTQGSAASISDQRSPIINPTLSGDTPTIVTSRSRSQSITRENLPPPQPQPQPLAPTPIPSPGVNSEVQGQSSESEAPLPSSSRSSSSTTVRPSQSILSSNNSCGGTPIIGINSRSRGLSFSRESHPSLSPPHSSVTSSVRSGKGVGGRGDSLDSDQHLTTTIVRDDSHTEPKRSRKRIKLTPEDLLDRNSITLYHLIHASIPRTKRTDKKKPKEKKPDDSVDDNNESNSEAGSKGLENSSETLRVENDDTMDSIMTTGSSASTIITAEPTVEEEPRETEAIGPRVKVGPDGQLIIDEESLVIRKPKPVNTPRVEETISGTTTYASFRKRPPTARWSKAETIEFYTALNLIGPDFSLMSNLFFNGKRSRTDLKNKFRRENKLNKPTIEKALYQADVEYCLARETV